MSNDVDKYLGPHRKLGPGSYELGAVPIVGRWRPVIEFGGGYTVWGPNEGPRRGEGGPSSIHELAKPNVMAEFMNEQIHNQKYIDREYSTRFTTLLADTERELKERIQAVSGGPALNPAESAAIEQKVTLDLIASKKAQYTATAPKIYGLYDQSPYFLMKVLPRQKMRELLNSGKASRDTLVELYDLFDNVYKSAMELKALSLSIDVLAGKLAELAAQREQAQVTDNEAEPYQRLDIIAQERDIYAQQLPEFLHTELVMAAGSVADMKPSQALSHYQTTMARMAATKTAEIKPVYAPPPRSRGGITIHYPAANPNIKSPLSKPELEALNELVYLQAHTKLGVKWQSYHDALLKTESSRHLTATSSAFGGLAERANQAEQIVDAQLLATDAIRIANTFRAPGLASATSPLFMTAAGTAVVIDAAPVTLQAALRSSIAALTGLAAGAASGLVIGVSALVYSSKLANGELPERYAFSTPLSDLVPKHGQDLSAIAAASGVVELPVRISSKTAADGQSEVFVAATDGITVPSKVRVLAATFNPEKNLYSVTTKDVPPRTLTWTPIVNPGNSSTTSPAQPSTSTVYTGVTVTPVVGRIDTFAGLADAGFDDFITVFPADSGLPPLYVMFRDPREDAGVATGEGQPVTGIWLGAAAQGEGAAVPSQIADQLRGKEFKNFRAFREAFWKAVASDPELAKQFINNNISEMKSGRSPFARKGDSIGGKIKFELHHVRYISKGGLVFDIDNVRVVTPKLHGLIHAKGE